MRISRTRKMALVAVVVVVVGLPWLALIPMGLWRGIAVLEPCDAKAQDRFGEDAAHPMHGEEHIRAFPPAWVCPLDNGESVAVSFLG